MSRILATSPGRHGDLLWALPTIRALSTFYERPIDLMLSKCYSSLADLLLHQNYLGEIHVNETWEIEEGAPITPREAPLEGYQEIWERVYHLGYRGWPMRSLPLEIWEGAKSDLELHHGEYSGRGVTLALPWISLPGQPPEDTQPRSVVIGFTDEWIELKMGLALAAAAHFPEVKFRVMAPRGSRHSEWSRALPSNLVLYQGGWLMAARMLARASLFFGCNSALWVLANAMGKRCVIVEPNGMRHNECFWVESPRNKMLGRGLEPGATFDARGAMELLEEVLS